MYIYHIKHNFTALVENKHKQFTKGEKFHSEGFLPSLSLYKNFFKIEKVKQPEPVQKKAVEVSNENLEKLQNDYKELYEVSTIPNKFINNKEWLQEKINEKLNN